MTMPAYIEIEVFEDGTCRCQSLWTDVFNNLNEIHVEINRLLTQYDSDNEPKFISIMGKCVQILRDGSYRLDGKIYGTLLEIRNSFPTTPLEDNENPTTTVPRP